MVGERDEHRAVAAEEADLEVAVDGLKGGSLGADAAGADAGDDGVAGAQVLAGHGLEASNVREIDAVGDQHEHHLQKRHIGFRVDDARAQGGPDEIGRDAGHVARDEPPDDDGVESLRMSPGERANEQHDAAAAGKRRGRAHRAALADASEHGRIEVAALEQHGHRLDKGIGRINRGEDHRHGQIALEAFLTFLTKLLY